MNAMAYTPKSPARIPICGGASLLPVAEPVFIYANYKIALVSVAFASGFSASAFASVFISVFVSFPVFVSFAAFVSFVLETGGCAGIRA